MLKQFLSANRKARAKWLLYVTHVIVWIPLAILFFDFWSNNLGAEPVREIILRTGEWSLILLVASLAITPLRIVFGWKQLFPLRKWLGLYAFMYVSLHLLSFVGLDYGFACSPGLEFTPFFNPRSLRNVDRSHDQRAS